MQKGVELELYIRVQIEQPIDQEILVMTYYILPLKDLFTLEIRNVTIHPSLKCSAPLILTLRKNNKQFQEGQKMFQYPKLAIQICLFRSV